MTDQLTSISLDQLDNISGGAEKAPTPAPAKKPAKSQKPISLDATNGAGGYILEDLGFKNPDDSGKYTNGTRAPRETLETFGKILSGGRK